MAREIPRITPRICGICPVSHHLASAKATDMLARTIIPERAKLHRELMHMGQYIQSHSMHFFHLAGPDLVFGFDADPAIRERLSAFRQKRARELRAQSRSLERDIQKKRAGAGER